MKKITKIDQAIKFLIDNPTLTVEQASLAARVPVSQLVYAFQREACLLRGVCPTCMRKLLPNRKGRPVPYTQAGEMIPTQLPPRPSKDTITQRRARKTDELREKIKQVRKTVVTDLTRLI